MTKHTPRPWKAVQNMKPGVRAANGDYVALNLKSEADAHLIAAAPDYDALMREAVQAKRITPGWLFRARAAIAKVEGREG